MSYAIVLRETGGPDKLHYEAVEVADPGPGEILKVECAVTAPAGTRLPGLLSVGFVTYSMP
jgi:hypothetical protein